MKTVMIIAAAAACLAAQPAMAQDSAVIHWSDLDLGTTRGAAALDRRVNQAASRLCGARPRGLMDKAHNTACRADILAQAEQKIAAIQRADLVRYAARGR